MSTVSEIVKGMEKDGICEKFYFCKENQDLFFLISPKAFDKEKICVIALGYPEKVGIWSNTLLRMENYKETSMRSYFEEFEKIGYGVVAINPHQKDRETYSKYISQLDVALELFRPEDKARKEFVFIGFSMGGGALVRYFSRKKSGLNLKKIFLLDPCVDSRRKGFNAVYSDHCHVICLYKPTGEFLERLFGGEIIVLKHDGDLIHGHVPYHSLPLIIEILKQPAEKKK